MDIVLAGLQAGNPSKGLAKKVYSRPCLLRYGSVKTLTASGSGNPENAGADTKMRAANSDRALKENIAPIGAHPLGIGLYLFDYKPEFRDACGHGRQFGVMADEVETVLPEAVSVHANGYKQVNYALLGISRSVH